MKPGPGRPKGATNKTTRDVRRAIALLAEKNVHRVDGWLERVARDDPARACEIFLRAIEYHIPKLTRTELTGLDGGAIEFADPLERATRIAALLDVARTRREEPAADSSRDQTTKH